MVDGTLLSDDDRLWILGRAEELGLSGMSGNCGAVAVAINGVLFGHTGELVAAANKYRWERENLLTGHVGVKVGDSIWDLEGTFDGVDSDPQGSFQEFLSWGMLDHHDPDWGLPDEKAGYEVLYLRDLDAEAVTIMLPYCGVLNPFRVLNQAKEERVSGAWAKLPPPV